MSELPKPAFEIARANESIVSVLAVTADDNCSSSSRNKSVKHMDDDGVHVDSRKPVICKPLSQNGDLEASPASRTFGQKAPRIGIRSQGKILLLDPHEVISVEAQGNYVMLRRQADAHMLRESISVAAEKLKPYGLMRIHRSVLVNKSYITEIRPMPSGDYRIRLKSGKEYTVTRAYKRTMRGFADTWIGLEAFADGV